MEVTSQTQSVRSSADASDTSPKGPTSGNRAAIGLFLFALAVVLPLFRQSGTTTWNSLWAEDGAIYFQQAYEQGGLAVLFRGWNGYLQLPPRALGAVSTFVPVRDLAVFCAVSAQIVNATLAVFVYWASATWIRSRLLRVALASLVVLVPALGYENTATITNTIWTFAAVAPWALLSSAERRTAVVARSAVAFLAATATPLTLIYLPLGIGYAPGAGHERRGRWSRRSCPAWWCRSWSS